MEKSSWTLPQQLLYGVMDYLANYYLIVPIAVLIDDECRFPRRY